MTSLSQYRRLRRSKGQAPKRLVISTGAKRSGEICGSLFSGKKKPELAGQLRRQ
jgi:hypothetical protein